jgi:predicted ATP-binding protein involved in virulence
MEKVRVGGINMRMTKANKEIINFVINHGTGKTMHLSINDYCGDYSEDLQITYNEIKKELTKLFKTVVGMKLMRDTIDSNYAEFDKGTPYQNKKSWVIEREIEEEMQHRINQASYFLLEKFGGV